VLNILILILDILSPIIDALAWIIEGVGGVLGIAIGGLVDFAGGLFDGGKSKKLGGGGIVTGPTMALIGEAGPEAVIPLGRGGMGDTFNFTVLGDTWGEDRLVEKLREEFLKIKEKNTTTGF